MIGAASRFYDVGGCAPAAGTVRALIALALCLTLGACAQSGAGSLDLSGPTAAKGPAANDNRSELAKATDLSGKEFAKEPRNPDKALAYARNLKALGDKRQALAVLQQAAIFSSGHRGLASEYGRLALEFDQVALAERLLAAADDPANPDWRVISARGTVLAKQGRYRDAIPLYERALALEPDRPSILNNLALARAMTGHADEAEPLLKRAVAGGTQDPRVSQNLALVLGLQGKYDEAKMIAARDLPEDKAAANVDYVRRIVMLEARPMPRADRTLAGTAKGPAARPDLRGPTLDDGASGWTPKVAVAPATR